MFRFSLARATKTFGTYPSKQHNAALSTQSFLVRCSDSGRRPCRHPAAVVPHTRNVLLGRRTSAQCTRPCSRNGCRRPLGAKVTTQKHALQRTHASSTDSEKGCDVRIFSSYLRVASTTYTDCYMKYHASYCHQYPCARKSYCKAQSAVTERILRLICM